ncbi:hypothetical protein LCGC14_0442800 [marine sediment metagenome]|uniref:Uncharacterized protein n=1 Tax=marine sediment metagenome TaxID=412755 RepID=A0A0F9SK04_9ZZZZ
MTKFVSGEYWLQNHKDCSGIAKGMIRDWPCSCNCHKQKSLENAEEL